MGTEGAVGKQIAPEEEENQEDRAGKKAGEKSGISQAGKPPAQEFPEQGMVAMDANLARFLWNPAIGTFDLAAGGRQESLVQVGSLQFGPFE